MSRWWVWLILVCVGCSPLTVGRRRELPVALSVDPEDIEATARPAAFVKPTVVTLRNGLELLVAEDHSAPLVEVAVLVGCGRIDDPRGLEGLTAALLHGSVEGGAGRLTASEQQDAFSRLGGAPGVGYDDGESWLSFASRTEDVGALSELITDALQHPELGARAVELAHRGAALLDQPFERNARLVRDAAQQSLFGPHFPLAHGRTAQSARAIDSVALHAHQLRCLRPEMVTIAISGDLSAAQAAQRFDALSSWAPAASPGAATRGPAQLPTQRRLLTLPTPDPGLTRVTFVGRGLPRGSPLRFASQILLQQVAGWLTAELRRTYGLVYSVEGDIELGPTTGASWVRFSTKPELAMAAIHTTLKLLEAIWSYWPIKADDVSSISAWSTHYFAQQRAASTVFLAARARRQGSTLAQALELGASIGTVTLNDVREVFVQTFKPSLLQIIVSGDVPKDVNWAQFGAWVSLDAKALGDEP